MCDTSQAPAPESFFRVLVFEPLQSKDDNRLPFQIHKKEDLVKVVIQGLRKSTTAGSLISTPPAWTGADAGLPGTRHLGAVGPVFALGSFIDLGISE